MLRIGGTITSEVLTKRGIGQIQRNANRTAMVEHKIHNLPLRFESNNLTRPGGPLSFKSRSGNYTKRKRNKYKHEKPNVFSGALRQAVLTTARVTATQKRSRLIAKGSSDHRLWSDRRDEIEAIAKSEEKQLQKTWLETVETLSADPRYKKKSQTKLR